jgi:hypothetical protein
LLISVLSAVKSTSAVFSLPPSSLFCDGKPLALYFLGEFNRDITLLSTISPDFSACAICGTMGQASFSYVNFNSQVFLQTYVGIGVFLEKCISRDFSIN